MRAAGDDLGQAGRRAHNGGDEPEKRGIGLEEGEKLDAGGQAGEEFVETHQRVVGAPRLAEGFQKGRRQLGQALARFARTGGAIAAEMPGPDDAADVARPLEAETMQGLERVRIVDVAGKDEIADTGGQFRRGLE